MVSSLEDKPINDLPPEILAERDRFEIYLASRGLRMTRQREAIFREVFRHHDHIDADELTDRIRKLEDGASRATVYRTLDLLAKADLVKPVGLGLNQRLYEHVHHGEHHDHLVCTQCGAIIEFFSDELENCQHGVCDKHDFHPVRHTMVIFGTCSKCKSIDDNIQG